MPTIELLTKSEYARRRGCSRAAVTLAVKRCAIPLTAGKLDPIVADAAWASRTDGEMARRASTRRRAPAAAPEAPAASAGDPPCATWRERRDRAQARLVELTLKEREGELLDVGRARREFGGMWQAVVGLLDSFPQRISHELVGEDEKSIYQALCEAIYRLRVDIYDGWLARARSGFMDEALKAMAPLNGRQHGK